VHVTRAKPRTLTKSRFKLALECPTKVFYSLDPRYVNTKKDDEFLQAHAEGDCQAGVFEKAMYKGGVRVTVGFPVGQVANSLINQSAG
jgi:hypothetical protein